MFYNPYEGWNSMEFMPVKVNFHTHAGVCREGECGALPLADVVSAYRQAGYGALAISNHDKYIPRNECFDGITLLDAIEYSAHPHMLLIGSSVFENVPHQTAIDKTVANGGFVILSHPNWMHKEYWPWDVLDGTTGFLGIEIINPIIFQLSGSGLALDAWDHLLGRGRAIYGFGNDDFHQWRDLERAYNVVFAKSSAAEDIRAAVGQGRSYASTGLALRHFDYRNQTITVEATFFCPTYVDRFHYRFVGWNGAVLQATTGKSASYTLDEKEAYVRVEVTSDAGQKLFLQPIMNCEFFGIAP